MNISEEKLCKDTNIYRYVDLDCFLQILEAKFFVAKKKLFSDPKDAGNTVPLHGVFNNFVKVCGENQGVSRKYTLTELCETFKASKDYLASCWSLSKDNILMWEAYTHGKCGVCIESTIRNVIAALDVECAEPYLICCSPMYYEGYSNVTDVDEILFRKSELYRGEDEFRFYFFRKETTDADKTTNSVTFDINPEVLIDRVSLSPFMHSYSAEILKRNLEKCYPFLIGRIEPNR